MKKKTTKKSAPTSKKTDERRGGGLDPIYTRLVKRGLIIDRRAANRKKKD